MAGYAIGMQALCYLWVQRANLSHTGAGMCEALRIRSFSRL